MSTAKDIRIADAEARVSAEIGFLPDKALIAKVNEIVQPHLDAIAAEVAALAAAGDDEEAQARISMTAAGTVCVLLAQEASFQKGLTHDFYTVFAIEKRLADEQAAATAAQGD